MKKTHLIIVNIILLLWYFLSMIGLKIGDKYLVNPSDLKLKTIRMKCLNPAVSRRMQRKRSRKLPESITRRRIRHSLSESKTKRNSHRRNRKTRTGSVKRRRKRAGIQVCRWCLWERKISAVPCWMT